jgi:1,4-alpha-glucan branching enzyme
MADTEPDFANAPMGGTLVSGGAIFRVWAPRANAVYVSGDFNGWTQDGGASLRQIGGGHWANFVSGVKDSDQYRFYVNGVGTSGYKRDPRARTLTFQPAFPFANCVLRNPDRFPWLEAQFVPPAFNDLII